MRKERDPKTEWVLAVSNRVLLRARMGDAQGAEQDYRSAIALNGDSEVPMHNLVHLGEELGEPLVRLD